MLTLRSLIFNFIHHQSIIINIMVAKQRVVFLDWLRVIACFMVMVVHASECVYSNDYSFSFPSELGRWSVCLINGFVRPAVPLFLMASAYLLVPLRTDTGTFFRKRLTRVVIPFVLWLVLYAVLPAAWGETTLDGAMSNLAQIAINFIPRASHLWFIYMLLGIYIIMPVLTPWLERVSRREEECYILLWLFTTLFWHAHEIFGDVFGECWWNPFPLFYYVSGYVGYVLLAHYIRKYLDWNIRKTLTIALPCFLVGYAMCIWSFYTRSFTVAEVRLLELSWQTTSFAPALMSFGAFMLIKQINYSGRRVYGAVISISAVSYGMYLMHMLVLPYVFVPLNEVLPVPVTIFATAAITYAATYVICLLISMLKIGKYIVG